MNNKDTLKEFLLNFPYKVMHEASYADNNYEHFFYIIEKNTIKNKIIVNYFKNYILKEQLEDLSKKTLEYKNENNDDYYFIYIDTLNKKDYLYEQKKNVALENGNNILCLKLINETCDVSSHISNNMDVYFAQFKDLSLGASLIAKDVLINKLNKTKEFYKENSPIIQKKISLLSNKISLKIQSLKNKI